MTTIKTTVTITLVIMTLSVFLPIQRLHRVWRLAIITVVIILVPCHVVKSLELIWITHSSYNGRQGDMPGYLVHRLTQLQYYTLQWRHNGRNGVSNHQPHHCLLNRSFMHRSKKTSKLRVTGICEGNSPVTGEFPAQMASNAENVSIWWRHHDYIQYKSMPM